MLNINNIDEVRRTLFKFSNGNIGFLLYNESLNQETLWYIAKNGEIMCMSSLKKYKDNLLHESYPISDIIAYKTYITCARMFTDLIVDGNITNRIIKWDWERAKNEKKQNELNYLINKLEEQLAEAKKELKRIKGES